MPDLPAAIDDVVARAMAKDRNDRFASCRELAQAARLALQPPAAVTSAPAAARPAQPREQVTATLRRPSPMVPPPARQDTGRPSGPRPPFQIRVHRTGADGMHELGPVYTDALSLLETGALEDLLDRAQFFRLPAHLPAERPVTGDVRQEITVISAGRTHAVGYDLRGSRRPPELDEFLGRLERLAGWRGLAPPPVPPPHVLSPPPPRLGPPPPAPGATPWWKRRAALAGLAAAAVLAVVLTLVVVVGGDDPLPATASVEAVTAEGTVELTWGGVEGALRYEVRRDGDLLDTTRDTSFVDESIEAGERYRYTVTALGSGDTESAASRPRSVTIPAPRADLPAPVELTVARTDGIVQVSWADVEGASSYNLFRGTVRAYGGPRGRVPTCRAVRRPRR